MKKLFAMLLVSTLVLGMLTSCGKKEEGSSKGENSTSDISNVSETSNKTELAKEITVAMAMNESEWQVMNDKVFKMFEEQTGIKVNGLQIEYAEMENKVQALHEAGKAEIDIVCPDNMLLAGLVEKGLIKDMTAEESLIPSNISENLYDGFKFDGKLYYFPMRTNAKINFYNETKFNEYNLEPPTNWEELKNVIKTFSENEDVGRYAIQANNGAPTTATLFEFITSAGGDPLVLNDAGSVEAYTFLQEIWPHMSSESKRANPNVINQLLATETVYYADNWPFAANILVKDNGKDNIKAHVGFAGPDRMVKVLGGSVMAVTTITEKNEEAKMFMEFLMSKEVQEIFCSEIGWAPIRNDAIGTMEDWQKPYFEEVLKALEYAEPRPIVNYWSDVDKAINDAFVEIVIDGNKDVQGVLDKYHANIEAAKNS